MVTARSPSRCPAGEDQAVLTQATKPLQSIACLEGQGRQLYWRFSTHYLVELPPVGEFAVVVQNLDDRRFAPGEACLPPGILNILLVSLDDRHCPACRRAGGISGRTPTSSLPFAPAGIALAFHLLLSSL